MGNDNSSICEQIEAHCERAGITPKTFGQKHFQNTRLHERLRDGGSITLNTYRQLCEILEGAAA